jgi:hypothetical protein
MDCPKCAGGAYLCEEELVKILENTDPIKIIIKASYQCKACTERFTRIIYDNLNARKKQEETTTSTPTTIKQTESVEGLKFF